MKLSVTGLGAALAILCATSLSAGALKLKPADPQPGALKPGLSVVYAYPADVKTLSQARAAVKSSGEAGPPLKGLDYRDTNDGDITLTSKRAHHVAARITGYVRFDKPGLHSIDFLSNDGMLAVIGGQEVSKFDGRQPCEPTYGSDVEIPVAGWYELDVLYFQRGGTACLHMRSGPAGKRAKWMPDSAFGH
jgi:hypothetical protein